MSNWEKYFALAGLFVFITTLLFGHQNLLVAIYGCLPYWFGLPVCFIIGKVLAYDDLIRIGKLFVYTSIVNSLLLLLQFNLPISHFLNYQGGNLNEMLGDYSISELAGGFRPSGLFIHGSHNALFQILALMFMLYFAFLNKVFGRIAVLRLALILQVVSLPCSISRTAIFYHIGALLYFIFVISSKQRMRLLKIIPMILIGLLFIVNLPFVKEALLTTSTRFAQASNSFHEDNTLLGTLKDLYERNIEYNVKALLFPKTINGESVPFWGYGQGMSTQIGGRLLSLSRNSGFYLAEWDGLRIMCESGYIFGWTIIFIRLGYAFRYLFRIGEIKRKHKYLSLIILPVFLLTFFLLNTWGNLFLANFSFLVGGLFLASTKYRIYERPIPKEREMKHEG